MNTRKEALHTFLLVLLYGLLFHTFQFFMHQRDMVSTLPNDTNLLFWDAGWYHSIAEKGYEYSEINQSNTGFYILFPAIWKLTHLGAWGMSVLNILLFAAGAGIMSCIFRLSMSDKILWLTIPSFYFCFIPYSEGIFFLLGAIVLFALVRRNKYLIWASLFLISLVRPVSTVLLPAFLITELVTNDRRNTIKSLGNFLLLYGLPLVGGLAFFVWYQYYETGVWFAYFKQQEKHWGHEFAMPSLPFNSMFGPKLLWLNAAALFIGFIGMCQMLYKGILWLFKNVVQEDKMLILSYLYLAALLLITILFNPIWGTFTTNVFDAHRYMFVTPFFWVFLHRYTQERTYRAKDFIIIILLSNAFWLLFASYLHIQYLLYFNFNTGLIVLYMLYANKKNGWPPIAIAIINFYLQISMYQLFIGGNYPG